MGGIRSLTTRFTQLFVLLLCFVGAFGGCTSNKNAHLGNVLRVAIREKIKSLDPAYASDYYSNIAASRTYESLLQYHYLLRPYTIEPQLAEGLPAVSNQGKTYTFKIKQNVRFQDDLCFVGGKGRLVTAKDFVYSFKRIADSKISSDGWWIFDGKIDGLNQWREDFRLKKATYDTPVEGLEAVDDQTLKITLTEKDPVFLHALTMRYASVVPREAVEKYKQEFGNHPVGTGPFRLERFSTNQLSWVKNENYHGATYPTKGMSEDEKNGLLTDAGKPIPFLDRIIDDVIVEDQPAWLNFIQGNHDYMMKIPKDNSANVWGKDKKPTPEMTAKGVKVLTTPAMDWTYVVFNMEDPVVGGKKNQWLRLAMSLAHDAEPMVDTFYHGLAIKSEFFTVPGIPEHDESYINPTRQWNLEKAKQLLVENGHPDGNGIPPLTYDVTSSTTARQLGEYFVRSMGKIGIQIKLNVVTWPELLLRGKKKLQQIHGVSWLYDYPDVQNAAQLLYSKNAAPGPNKSNYSDPEYDRLYERLIKMNPSDARRKVLEKMRAIVERDVPWIFNLHRMETRLTAKWLHNYKIHHFEHGIVKYLRLDDMERKKALKQ